MSLINDQEKKIFHHIMAIFELVEKNEELLEKSCKKMTPEEMDQSEFNCNMKEQMLPVLDYLGTRIGRKAMTKEFGIHIG